MESTESHLLHKICTLVTKPSLLPFGTKSRDLTGGMRMEAPHSFTPSFSRMEYRPPSCHFLVGFSLAQLIKGQKRIQRLKECGDCWLLKEQMGFPGGSDGKESACTVGDSVSIPGSGRTPGRGNGNALQYSCLEDSVGQEAWRATFHGVTKSWT